jgi:gliding motility-associated-like protein
MFVVSKSQIMKKIIYLLIFLFAAVGFSQPITVSSSSYTVPQLVNNVLINSPCVSATNVTWRTGTDYSSSNGLGYFENTNPGFPMQSGVVLSTGNAINSPGPNNSMLNDGSTSWAGDAQLEATLAASGISMVSKNATVLEFDFIPISPRFSFDFIFASEEYGNFQCQYSDAFAFLLTNNSTGTTTNLAVVPSTTLPISVITIRDFLYNSSCASANAQFFGRFNGGSAAPTSAINFNGQTKVLTAASTLTPGVSYHIKLVIADRLDNQSDSAIFISSDSFNIGQDVLGQDLTIANNTALCNGDTHVLNTNLNPANYTFVWKKGDDVLSATGPTLTVSEAGNYSVTYTNIFSTCQPITDSVIIEYYEVLVTPNPVTVYKCDTGAATHTYNLDYNTEIIKTGLDPATSVSYFASQADAEANINPLPLQYNTTSSTRIYVRIQLPNNPCFVIKSFQVMTTPGPIANQPPNITECARSATLNNSFFGLQEQTPLILNGQSSAINIVSYYTSQVNANNATNPITNLTNEIFTSTTIYVRVENVSDPACFSTTSFQLIVEPAPLVDRLENVIVCSNYILQPLVNGNYFTSPGGTGIMMHAGDEIIETTTLYIFNQPNAPDGCSATSVFKVTIIDPNQFDPTDFTGCNTFTVTEPEFGEYYTQPGGQGSLIPTGTVINSSQTIYLYYVTLVEPFCVIDTDVLVNIVPTIEVGEREDVFNCTSYTLPSLSIGKYYTGPNATGNELAGGTTITTTQTIYVFAGSSTSTACSDQDEFNVYIGFPQPENIDQCNGYTLPDLPIGHYYSQPMGAGAIIPDGTVIESSQTIYIYIPVTGSGSNCTDNLHFDLAIAQPYIESKEDVTVCETYTLPEITDGEYFTEPEGQGVQLFAGDVILETKTIYIFKRLNDICYNENTFIVNIIPLPQIDSRSDIDICDQYVLTALDYGKYFTGPNATGTELVAGTIITTSQRIYIYVISDTTPSCSAENSFQINIFSTQAQSIESLTACDHYTLPTLTAGNVYYTQSGGPDGTGTTIAAGTVITSTQTIYIFKESVIRTSFSCIDETLFTITINPTPVLAAIADVNVCGSYALPVLTVGNYYSAPNGGGTMLHAGDYIFWTQTLYVYAHTGTTPDCSAERSFVVNVFQVDKPEDVVICESYTLPALTLGNYYTGPGGTGNILQPGSLVRNSKTIYIYAVSSFTPRCTSEYSFEVTIIKTPLANFVPAGIRTTCDEDGVNDGVTPFELSTLNASVLGTQTGSEFTLSYHQSFEDATTNTNPITSTDLAIVYVRVNNTLAPTCFDVKPISIIVNKLPEPAPSDGVVCIDSETGNLLNAYVINSGLPATGHTFEWKNEAGIVVGNRSLYTASQPGIYSVTATNIATGCTSEPALATVIQSEPAVVGYTVSEEFTDNQIITVIASGEGADFEYQLDNGPFQDSPIFEGVMSGIHSITVRDKNGCGSTTVQALVVNYPKYFTPNGDGYNDTWNIKDLATSQPNANIFIYDRYGKLLKQLNPGGQGWDGTYNGRTMLSDDYWFTVNYLDENQTSREFRAHFAMKR